MNKRPTITKAQRVECWDKSGGICHICRVVIDPRKQKWEAEHIIPLGLKGGKTWPNLQPAHVDCHKVKTAKDKGDIAQAVRRRANDIGAKGPPKGPPLKGRGFETPAKTGKMGSKEATIRALRVADFVRGQRRK